MFILAGAFVAQIIVGTIITLIVKRIMINYFHKLDSRDKRLVLLERSFKSMFFAFVQCKNEIPNFEALYNENMERYARQDEHLDNIKL